MDKIDEVLSNSDICAHLLEKLQWMKTNLFVILCQRENWFRYFITVLKIR
jgi:hypothetical protein